MKILKWGVMAALLTSSSIYAAAQGPIIQLQSGRIEGTTHEQVDAFLGIPYAKPPVGKLRWHRPLSPEPWQGIKKTTEYGPGCPQVPYDGDTLASLPPNFSEDCLTINVWRPNDAVESLPVMVWIHGGGFMNGGSASPTYSGESFARNGVILVSFNYRLGQFGFFAHPGLRNKVFRGNYGIMDQIKALHWVQDNIVSFGGDPNNVTVFGESAGGYAINALLTSHYSRNLFNKAIIESGGGRHQLGNGQHWDQAEQVGVNFARTLGIEGADQQALERLRALPVDDILGDMNMWNMNDHQDIYGGSILDGRLLREHPESAYESGDFAHVPLLVGTNDYDLGFVNGSPTTRDEVFNLFGLDPIAANAAYSGEGSLQELAYRIAMQQFMIEPARFVAREFVANNTPVWEYRFGYVASSQQGQQPGATHASEMAYVFNTLKAVYGQATTSEDQAMATMMHQYWINFAKTGNPNGPGLPEWPQYQTNKDRLMWFSPQGASDSQTIADPMKTQLDVIEPSQS
ncbi:carboxylesterase/lipase family protein [Celerinatantimonas sp. YJH-8]|uniref:carboxylesterase/lipase family protein n=1 Tax=Celerinatantimonas sp. YJH-8 TaxID=3228714 RepID=UPI0038C73073